MVAYQALCSLTLGEAQLLAGRLEEAHALLSGHWRSPGVPGTGVTRRMPCACSATSQHGASHLIVEQAEAHYQHALALAEELGMRPLQAHCHHGLGTLYRQTGRAALARAALSTAIALYRAMDMTFWLPAAEAALAKVAETKMWRSKGPHLLLRVASWESSLPRVLQCTEASLWETERRSWPIHGGISLTNR